MSYRMGCRIYVGRLSHRATERDVKKFFRNYGHLREVVLKNGYGFVEFEDDRDADDAVYELNGKDLCGDRVLLEHARGPGRGRGAPLPSPGYGGGGGGSRSSVGMSRYGPPVRTKYRVVVENLSTRVSWQDLKDFMRTAGAEVCYADAHRDRKNEGVVEFASRHDMERAIKKLDDTDLSGRTVRLVEDGRSRSRSRSRSRRRRSYSRSPSRSRSRSRRRARSNSRRSRSRSDSRSRSKSRSPSRTPRRSRTPKRSRTPRRSKRSRSRSSGRSRSRSRSPKAKSTDRNSPDRKSLSRSVSIERRQLQENSGKDEVSPDRRRSASKESNSSRELNNGIQDEEMRNADD